MKLLHFLLTGLIAVIAFSCASQKGNYVKSSNTLNKFSASERLVVEKPLAITTADRQSAALATKSTNEPAMQISNNHQQQKPVADKDKLLVADKDTSPKAIFSQLDKAEKKAIKQAVKQIYKDKRRHTLIIDKPQDDGDDEDDALYLDWLGLAGFGLGVAALVLFFIPIIPLILGALAITFSIGSIFRMYREPDKYIGKSFAILGLIFGALAIILGIVFLLAIISWIA